MWRYLHQVTNLQHRITLTKLHLSNHKFAIETGRYVRPYKKLDDRICPFCRKDGEDEIHFLTLYPVYQEKKSILFWILKEYRISINRMAPDDVFLLLINPPSKKKHVQKLIA